MLFRSNDTATTESYTQAYTLSLHDALPICVLEARVHRVAEAGQLRVSEHRAVDAIQAAGVGAINVILSTPPERRDPGLAEELYAAVMARILTTAPVMTDSTVKTASVALRALTPQLDMLSEAERRVLDEWLDRAIAAL